MKLMYENLSKPFKLIESVRIVYNRFKQLNLKWTELDSGQQQKINYVIN